MKILTVDGTTGRDAMLHHVLTQADKDTFHISAADCGADCQCGRHAAHATRDHMQPVSDAQLRELPLTELIKLQAPRVSPSQEQVWLAGRATRELHRRFLLTGDMCDADPIDMQNLSVTELIRCAGPKAERPTPRQEVLAKRALTELFRRQYR